MSKNNEVLARGVVIEALPNATFRIEKEDGGEIRAYVSGRMKMNRIRVIVGDKVEYVVDQQGPNNRIIKRL